MKSQSIDQSYLHSRRRPLLFRNEEGGAFLLSVLLTGVVAIGAYLTASLASYQTRLASDGKFSLATQALRAHAAAILNDPKSCELAFQGQPIPTTTAPTTSKLPNSALRMDVPAGTTGLPEIAVNQKSVDGQLLVSGIRLVNRGGTPAVYMLELEVAKDGTLRGAGHGGDDGLRRAFEVSVLENPAAPGTILSCSTVRIEEMEWQKVCEAAGSHYDPAANTCVVCPTAGEVIVGWTNPTTPVCKSVEQIACEAMGTAMARWDAAAKTCFRCASGYQVLRAPASGSMSCVDSVDIASFVDGVNSPCPAGQQKTITYIDEVMTMGCI